MSVDHDKAQSSSFLRLPPELRNSIYEYAARDAETVSICLDRILYCPPLSLVRRQVREEFEEIYVQEAPKCAP